MQIYINNQKLDYSLENEKYFADIYQALSNWLIQSGMVISKIKINDFLYSAKDILPYLVREIPSIDKLEIEAEKDNDNYCALIEYFQLFIDSVNAGNNKVSADLSNEYKYVKDAILNFIGNTDEHKKTLELLSNYIEKADYNENFLNICKYFRSKLQNTFMEQNFPKIELVSSVLFLEKQLDNYCNISVMLQTGKDKEAFQLILDFIENAQKIIRIVNFLKEKYGELIFGNMIGNKSSESFFKELSSILHDLVNGFENEDIIQIGDIMEYEIVPVLQSMIDEIKKIK